MKQVLSCNSRPASKNSPPFTEPKGPLLYS